MAEGWARHFFDHKFTIYSAGIETHGLNPNAVLVMSESGIDISTQKSQHIDEFEEMSLDLIVTVCGHAHENCPVLFQESPVIHRGFPDPPKLAADESDAERKLGHYRDVRDMIKSYVETQLIVDLESAIK
ncbi:MAG: arsenate reductase ArsC [Lentisphaeria bacterium]|nr:arsenate reductase ArsC [Lentisphaeria bacterium]